MTQAGLMKTEYDQDSDAPYPDHCRAVVRLGPIRRTLLRRLSSQHMSSRIVDQDGRGQSCWLHASLLILRAFAGMGEMRRSHPQPTEGRNNKL